MTPFHIADCVGAAIPSLIFERKVDAFFVLFCGNRGRPLVDGWKVKILWSFFGQRFLENRGKKKIFWKIVEICHLFFFFFFFFFFFLEIA